jgi:ATP-binding cassette subfamily B protein
VDLVIPAGTAVAVAGRNGAGKSTIVKLLCRLYDPTRGAILWDGVDLRELDVSSLRDRCGVLFQDFMAYDLSAAENIAVGDLSQMDDRAAIEAAAVRAGAHDALVQLPDGYRTMLTRTYFGEQDREDPATGVVLSGGQWQRVALARTILRQRRDLLILDEPSSGLDARAESEVHRQVTAYRQGGTSVLVSHRLGAVRTADTIVVLDDGRIVEQGPHRRLVSDGGLYADLFALQAEGYVTA